VIYDGDDQTAIVKRCFAELNLDPNSTRRRQSSRRFRKPKQNDFTGGFRQTQPQLLRGSHRSRLRALRKKLIESKALDFDDLLGKWCSSSAKTGNFARYQERYIHVMVDDFRIPTWCSTN